MGNEAPVVTAPAAVAASAVTAPVAPAVAPAAAPAAVAAAPAAPAAPATAATAPAVVPATAEAIATATAAHTAAVAAAQGKAADSPEGKAAATAKAALDALKPAPAAAVTKKAPEAYTDFVQPQGVTFNKGVIEALKGVGKTLDLDQAQMQTLIDKVAPEFVKGEKEQVGAFINKVADQWRAETLADAELGGETSPAKLAVALKTFDVFGTPKLRMLLNNTGLGDHPELLRWAFRIGSAIGPDNKFVAGTTLTKVGVAPEDKLWPTK